MSTFLASPRSRPRLQVFGFAAAQLLLRPDRYLRAVLRYRGDRVPLVLVWFVGMAAMIDSAFTRSMINDGFGRAQNPLYDSWYATWPTILVGGVLAGALAWLIRGWWFRIRLRLSGAPADISAQDARIVWVHATAVYAVPTVVLLVLQTPFHPNLNAYMDSSVGYLTDIGLLLWSMVVGYRAAVGCFPVGRLRAIFWFLVLPAGFFLIATLAAVATTWGAGGLF